MKSSQRNFKTYIYINEYPVSVNDAFIWDTLYLNLIIQNIIPMRTFTGTGLKKFLILMKTHLSLFSNKTM